MAKYGYKWLKIAGWTGTRCEDNVDECMDSPCENGGMCMDIPGDFFCSCPFGNSCRYSIVPICPSRVNFGQLFNIPWL